MKPRFALKLAAALFTLVLALPLAHAAGPDVMAPIRQGLDGIESGVWKIRGWTWTGVKPHKA